MPCAFTGNRPEWMQSKINGCQFAVPDAELIDFQGQTFCPMHVPLAMNVSPRPQRPTVQRLKPKAIRQRLVDLIERSPKNAVLDLTGLQFEGDLDLTGITLPAVSLFHWAIDGNLNLQGAHFTGHADISGSTFYGETDFSTVTFDGEASFFSTTFRDAVKFSAAQFCGPTNFSACSFPAHPRAANFMGTVFDQSSDFSYSNFGLADFRNSIFSHNAEFHHSYMNSADFRSVRFHEQANFSSDNPSSAGILYADFSDARFGASALFNDRTFSGHTDFARCSFAQAPEFHGAKLHEDTSFDGTKFLDHTSQGARAAYRTLKLAMESRRARHDEAMFFAHEQRSIRHNWDTPKMTKFFSWLYDCSCDYGRSISRPLLWLTVCCVVFGLGYEVCAEGLGHNWAAPSEIVGFVISQVVRPFSVWSETSVVEARSLIGNSPWGLLTFRFLATLQSILSLALIALFFLTLRRRFRMA